MSLDTHMIPLEHRSHSFQSVCFAFRSSVTTNMINRHATNKWHLCFLCLSRCFEKMLVCTSFLFFEIFQSGLKEFLVALCIREWKRLLKSLQHCLCCIK